MNWADTSDVIVAVMSSMIDTYSDDFGSLDFRRSQHGSGMSSRSQVDFTAALHSAPPLDSCLDVYTTTTVDTFTKLNKYMTNLMLGNWELSKAVNSTVWDCCSYLQMMCSFQQRDSKGFWPLKDTVHLSINGPILSRITSRKELCMFVNLNVIPSLTH